MLGYFIKFITLLYVAYYMCFTLLKSKFNPTKKTFIILLSIFTIPVVYYLSTHIPKLIYTTSLLLIFIFAFYISSRIQFSIILTTISYCLSICLYGISSFIIDFIAFALFNHLLSYTVFSILSSFLQILLVILIFRIKRFKNGFYFLFSTKIINIATFVCVILLSLLIYIYTEQNFLLGFCSIILTLAFLIYWWQAQITKAYRRNLELRELESMRTEMAELKLKMQELTDENERLARITHRDNTLISALKKATEKYLSTDFANPAVALETRNQLLENINTLSIGRTSFVDKHKEKSSRKFETGLKLLDALLHEMDEKALEMNISFAVHMGTSLDSFIPKEISEEDLVHTVDDLLKNAFKATTSCEKRMVQLQFYKLGKHFVVEVADTGIPFEVKSLVNMGIEKLTTYEDGSGIGLVDIWTTKEKYGATYHLDECINAATFSKKVSLTFDKKNRYSIRTLRKDEILQMSRRADLQVYDYNEQ